MCVTYEKRYSLDVEKLTDEAKTDFAIHPAESYYPASTYAFVMDPNTLVPLEYTDWRDETESWHRTCSLCTQLSPSPVTTISGPEAVDFMRENFPNNVDKCDIGASKYGLMLLDDGAIAAQGVVMRSGEQEYKAYWMSPFIDYRFSQKDWDATCVTTLDEVFVFQMQGPKSLAILEEATGCDLHDIAFLHSKEAVWNPEDLAKVFLSQLTDEPLKRIDFPYDHRTSGYGNNQDRVLDADGNRVGNSMWPLYTLYYHEMISICAIDPACAAEGTEVQVVWSDCGQRQTKIRAKVARFPYLDITTNQAYDIDSIPRLQGQESKLHFQGHPRKDARPSAPLPSAHWASGSCGRQFETHR